MMWCLFLYLIGHYDRMETLLLMQRVTFQARANERMAHEMSEEIKALRKYLASAGR